MYHKFGPVQFQRLIIINVLENICVSVTNVKAADYLVDLSQVVDLLPKKEMCAFDRCQTDL